VIPDDFVDQLDDDAFELLFGSGKQFHQLTAESRRMARAGRRCRGAWLSRTPEISRQQVVDHGTA
jgi:hypothetical protein